MRGGHCGALQPHSLAHLLCDVLLEIGVTEGVDDGVRRGGNLCGDARPELQCRRNWLFGVGKGLKSCLVYLQVTLKLY